jgi:precorrin-6Y C5,15-methyltransferase (decarboxylating)
MGCGKIGGLTVMSENPCPANTRLYVVGLGCGAPELVTGPALDVIGEAGAVFVSRRLRDTIGWRGDVVVMDDPARSMDDIESRLGTQDVAVAVSGDPGIFSFLRLLRERFGDLPGNRLKVIPGISSLQYLFAALGETWADVSIISAHGRETCELDITRAVHENRAAAIFCDPIHNPEFIIGIVKKYCRDFSSDDGGVSIRIAVGENLSMGDERITVIGVKNPGIPRVDPPPAPSFNHLISSDEPDGPAAGGKTQLPELRFEPPALVAVFNESPEPFRARRPKDEDFIRSGAPMTRQEVRSAILDELDLRRGSVVWDVGAGTGSVAISCAKTCWDCEVHAVERSPDAVGLIRRNMRKFKAFNLRVHEGTAPDILTNLPIPTHVFIGGSGGRLEEIMRYVADLRAGIVITASAVTLRTIRDASRVFMNSDLFGDPSVVSISAARSRNIGDACVMSGQNPVMLWTTRTIGRGH